jgi:hypothetical protein
MAVMRKAWLLLLPELRRFPPEEQDCALAKARETVLDVPELIGMAFAVVAVTALTQYSLADASALSRFAAALVNFAVALPLMVLCAGPFHVRRLRRGLRAQLELRGQHE